MLAAIRFRVADIGVRAVGAGVSPVGWTADSQLSLAASHYVAVTVRLGTFFPESPCFAKPSKHRLGGIIERISKESPSSSSYCSAIYFSLADDVSQRGEQSTRSSRTVLALPRLQRQLQRYEANDDEVFGCGLTCDGFVDVLIEPVSRDTFPQLGSVAEDIAPHRPMAIATVVSHPSP